MKIVIVGEFSSFAKNLSEGFRALGHECFVFSWGDGFKKIKQDAENSYEVNARYNGGGLIRHIEHIFHSTLEYLRLRKFVFGIENDGKWDAVLIINPCFIKDKRKFWEAGFTKEMIFALVNNKKNVYLSACGGDIPYFDYWRQHKWKNEETVLNWLPSTYTQNKIKHHQDYSQYINKVIPVMYGYAEAWRCSQLAKSYQVLPTIPLPVNCSKFTVKNDLRDKIVVFHGIIRPVDKGTKYIKAAMERLQKEYPDEVECRAEGGLPLNEYLELLDRTNILVDQCCGDYVGMNGLYGLAMGKVVVACNDPLNQKEINGSDCPIVDIGPDADQIFHALEGLILNRKRISEISRLSRKYVERVHDAEVVARKYVDLFMEYNH